MRSTLLLSSLLPLALASPLFKRDGASIVAAINDIEANIATLNNTLNTFQQGSLTGIVTVLEIQGQTNDLGDSIKAATSTAQASAPLNDTESGNVAFAVLDLQPQIFSLLDNIVAHKPAFDSAILGVISVSPQVEQDLQDQKALSDDFGAAIVEKLTPTFASLAPPIIQQIDDAFDEAIAAFATPGGLIALPPLPDFDSFKAAVEKAAGESEDSSDAGLLGIL